VERGGDRGELLAYVYSRLSRTVDAGSAGGSRFRYRGWRECPAMGRFVVWGWIECDWIIYFLREAEPTDIGLYIQRD
jgi:hypothetical protein